MPEDSAHGDFHTPDRPPGLLANDAGLIDRIDTFIGDLQLRIGCIERAWQEGRYAELRFQAGQLRHAEAGGGREDIAHLAADLESLLSAEDPDIVAIGERTQALTTLCRGACLGSHEASN